MIFINFVQIIQNRRVYFGGFEQNIIVVRRKKTRPKRFI